MLSDVMQSFHTQVVQNFSQHTVTLFKAGDGIHNLMIGHMAANLIQLVSQLCQFFCMGSIVTSHILHQRQKFVHGSMAVMMLVAVLMQMIVGMRMFMRMRMLMVVCMGMGMAVMRMFVGVFVLVRMAMVMMVFVEMMIVHSFFSFYSFVSFVSSNR